MNEELIKKLQTDYQNIPIPKKLEEQGLEDLMERLEVGKKSFSKQWILFAGFFLFIFSGFGIITAFSSEGTTLYPIKQSAQGLINETFSGIESDRSKVTELDLPVTQPPASSSAEIMDEPSTAVNEDNKDNNKNQTLEDEEKMEEKNNRDINWNSKNPDDKKSFKTNENEEVKGKSTENRGISVSEGNKNKNENNGQRNKNSNGKNYKNED